MATLVQRAVEHVASALDALALQARRLLDAYRHATEVERRGAVMHEGQMIDEASRKITEAIVARGVAAGMAREAG